MDGIDEERRKLLTGLGGAATTALAGCVNMGSQSDIPEIELNSVSMKVNRGWADYVVVYPDDDVVVYRHTNSSSAGEAAVHSPELAENYMEKYREKTNE